MFSHSTSTLLSTSVLLLTGVAQVQAHIAPWTKGIWECTDGKDGNNDLPARPLFMLPKFGPNGWWFHGDKCIASRPPPDQVLELPAGGQFNVEFAGNKGQTTLSFGGKFAKVFGDGNDHPEGLGNDHKCITSPNLHAKDEDDASAYAFAISYQSDFSKVTLDNLVVFTTKYKTPFRRQATYDVPANMPECPPGGCICAALWIPNHCGEPNGYMIGYNCKVTNVKSTARPLAPAKTPVFCEDDPSKCVKGAKGVIVFNQLEGNNIDLTGNQKDGQSKSPGYNQKTGFADGAQNDIFLPPSAPKPRVRRQHTGKNRWQH